MYSLVMPPNTSDARGTPIPRTTMIIDALLLPEPMDHIEHDVVLVRDREGLACEAAEAYAGIGPL
jgi:hypothetical protein